MGNTGGIAHQRILLCLPFGRRLENSGDDNTEHSEHQAEGEALPSSPLRATDQRPNHGADNPNDNEHRTVHVNTLTISRGSAMCGRSCRELLMYPVRTRTDITGPGVVHATGDAEAVLADHVDP